MDEKELKEKLDSIRGNLNLFDSTVNHEWTDTDEHKIYLNKRQANAVTELLNLFQGLNWQLALNSYKQLEIKKDEPIDTEGCGTPVKVRPCGEEYGNKTYFGVLIGHLPLSISCSVDKKENLLIGHSYYNPAIFVPELKKIIYGCGSWWGEIKSEEELKKYISDDTIKNVWYAKMLSAIQDKEEKDGLDNLE